MIKKLLSISLSLFFIINIHNTHAWTPTDFNDPKCINLKGLGQKIDYISKGEPVCNCKTCTIDAMTYDKIENYVSKLNTQLNSIDRFTPINKQEAINYESGKYAAVNLIFVTESLAAILHPLVRSSSANHYIKGTYFLIMSAGVIIGLLCQFSQTKYETIFFENKAKLNNIKLVLQELSKDINNKKFENRNFLLVSTNFDQNSPDAISQFCTMDGISYNESLYGEEYFNKINEEKVKPLLEIIDKGHFCTYENASYDTELRDLLKKATKVTLPIALLSDAYILFKLYREEVLEYTAFGQEGLHIGEFLKKHSAMIAAIGTTNFFGALFAFFKGESFESETAKNINNLLKTGANTVTILIDNKSKEQRKQENQQDQKDL